MKINEMSLKELRKALSAARKFSPDSDGYKAFQKELLRRELQTKELSYFLSIEEASAFLGILPNELETGCANNALAYSYIPNKGFIFDIRKIGPLIPADSFEAAWKRVEKVRDVTKNKTKV